MVGCVYFYKGTDEKRNSCLKKRSSQGFMMWSRLEVGRYGWLCLFL